jgi:hypothetical protein
MGDGHESSLEPGHEDSVELEPLRAMEGEQLDGIGVDVRGVAAQRRRQERLESLDRPWARLDRGVVARESRYGHDVLPALFGGIGRAGLEIGDVLADEERAISTYRYAVSQIIPALTEAAWRDKRDEILAQAPDADRARVVFAYRPVDFEEAYGRNYQKPARFARFLAWVYRIVPKVGPLRPLAFKAPTPEVDRLFEDSIAQAHARFQAMLRQVRDGRLDLSNTNFDTGEPAHAHDYALADDTHAEWLEGLAKHDFAGVSPAVRRTLDAYYRNAPPPAPTDRKARKAWERVQAARARLDRVARADTPRQN